MRIMDDTERVLGIRGTQDLEIILQILKRKYEMTFSKKIPTPEQSMPMAFDPPIHLIISLLTSYVIQRKNETSPARKRAENMETPRAMLYRVIPSGLFARIKLTYADEQFKHIGRSWNPTLIQLIERTIKITDDELEFILSTAVEKLHQAEALSESPKYTLLKYVDYLVYSIINGVPKTDAIIPTCVSVELLPFSGVDNNDDDGTGAANEDNPTASPKHTSPMDDTPAGSGPVTRQQIPQKAGGGSRDASQHDPETTNGAKVSDDMIGKTVTETDDTNTANSGDEVEIEVSEDDPPAPPVQTEDGSDTEWGNRFIASVGFEDIFSMHVIPDDPDATRKNDPDTIVFYRLETVGGRTQRSEVSRCGKKSLHQTFFRVVKRFLTSREGMLFQRARIKETFPATFDTSWVETEPEILLFLFFTITSSVVKFNATLGSLGSDTELPDDLMQQIRDVEYDDILRFFISSRVNEYLTIARSRLRSNFTFNDVPTAIYDVMIAASGQVPASGDVKIKRGPGRPRKVHASPEKKKRRPVVEKAVVSSDIKTKPVRKVKRSLETMNHDVAEALCGLGHESNSVREDADGDAMVVNTSWARVTVDAPLLLSILDTFSKCRGCTPQTVIDSMVMRGRDEPAVDAIYGLFGFDHDDTFNLSGFLVRLAQANIERNNKEESSSMRKKIRQSFG